MQIVDNISIIQTSKSRRASSTPSLRPKIEDFKMNQINSFNIIKMLYNECYSLKYESEVSQEEIDLKNHIIGL